MNYYKILPFLIVFFFGCQFSGFAQQDTTVLRNILQKTKKLSDTEPLEKVYLHFDKPYYSVADTIWFKAYLTTQQNMLSPLSKIVYVDIMNSQDSLVNTLKLPITDGVGYGNMPIDITNFKQGNYYVRAYTLWMLNFSPDYFFTKTIPIGNAVDKKALTNIKYTTIQTDKGQSITARIQFKNEDKIAIANRPVTWKMISSYDLVAQGKGTTDQNGYLTVEINSKKGSLIKKGELLTDLTMVDKEVVNTNFEITPTVSENDLQFFPEGGELYTGVPTQIAFKALKSNGLGIDLSGTLVDNDGNQVTTFNSTHIGMGSFYLNADAGKTYKANVTFKDGSKKIFSLPQARESGVNLQVVNTAPDVMNVKIVANEPYFTTHKGQPLYLVAQHNNVIYYAAQTALQNQVTSAKIPKDKFPSGIVQVTLFSAAGEPVSERISFVMHKDAMALAVQTDLPAYKPRQKVKMTVTAKNATQKIAGNFSVSVIDESKVPSDENAETTILSSLLLTSDLKGYIEKPNYYFNKTDDKKLAELDMLMLTQGYRRFSYKEILADKLPAIAYLPEQGMDITGILRDRTGMPVKKGALRLTVPGKTISAETLTSNTGLFSFKNLNIPDSSQVVITSKYTAGSNNMMIMVDPTPGAELGTNINAADEVMNIDSTLSNYLSNAKRQYSYMRNLKEVVIKGAAIKKVTHADYSSLSTLGNMPEHVIDPERLKDCRDLVTCLKTMGTGLTFFENQFYITRDYNAGGRTPVGIFIAGNPVDLYAINGVNVNEIESIEIFLKDELGTVSRTYGTSGVISVNMKKIVKTKMSREELSKLMPKNNVITISPKGFSKQREFYSPRYTTAFIAKNDLRTTIYWNPKVITDPTTGAMTFEFFNADGKGNYKAVVEGIDNNGNIGRTIYRYIVK
ncbi:MAG: carboxypeptidase regulatory-like domain-containing protein [Chryseobacterium sp.]|nr:MAG: carboxypeptidase regulatory-like domain-containing protein [Chryseobacterium sp.]